jgi:prepilin-type N-terminal cleavage/methylation domain-containing protein
MKPHPLRPTRRSQQGMGLLEVLAAMVILSVGATIAFTWFNQSANALAQVKTQEAELLARNEALDYLQHINPDEKPEGQIDLPGYSIHWRSQPLHPPVKSVTNLGMASNYSVSLHQLQVVLRQSNNRQQDWVRFELTLAGHTQNQSAARSIFGSSSGVAP